MRAKNLEDKFHENIEPIPESGCWIWTGTLYKSGYGVIGHMYKQLYAHRVAYELYFGKIEEGKLILHKCDVKCCVNPYHLYQGTHSDNLTDSYYRNKEGRRKLTPKNAENIRNSNDSKIALAIKYNVTERTIRDVKSGRAWGKL